MEEAVDYKVNQSDAAEASSAHARINIPLNLNNWKDVPEEFHADLLWFHQHLLDDHLDWNEAAAALGYDRSVIFRVLKGTYSGAWKNVCRSIRSYRTIVLKRKAVKRQEFSANSLTRLIWSTLDYAVANNCCALIVGESGMGKSTAMQAWRDANNHGRSVYVDCPPVGGCKGFLSAISHSVGVNKNLPTPAMLEAVTRSFNPNRILLLDNMHRALPADPRSAAKAFDIVQHIFDETGCAIGMTATARMTGQMRHALYMYEQILGRVGTPVMLPEKVAWSDLSGIVEQYVKKPSAAMREACLDIANTNLGHIRQLVERLKLASRIAHHEKAEIEEEHFFKAIRLRDELSRHNKDEPPRRRR
jgi:DNA transposition AAA+ family ATPase